MAEDAKNAKAAEAGGSGIVFKLLTLLGIPIIAVILSVVVFTYVIVPRLATDAATTDTEDAAAASDTELADDGMIPAGAVEVQFDRDYANAKSEDIMTPASMIIYKVTLVCLNQETASVVESKKSYFIKIINDQHSYRSREELISDPSVKEAIEKQIVKECNIQLLRLRNTLPPEYLEEEVKLRVIQALHEQFIVQDQI